MFRQLGIREESPAVTAAATDLRQRAYTRLVSTYEDTQRAITFLLDAKGGVEAIAPGLRPGRPGRRKEEEDTVAEPVPPRVGGVPVSSPALATAEGAATPARASEEPVADDPADFAPGGPFMK